MPERRVQTEISDRFVHSVGVVTHGLKLADCRLLRGAVVADSCKLLFAELVSEVHVRRNVEHVQQCVPLQHVCARCAVVGTRACLRKQSFGAGGEVELLVLPLVVQFSLLGVEVVEQVVAVVVVVCCIRCANVVLALVRGAVVSAQQCCDLQQVFALV